MNPEKYRRGIEKLQRELDAASFYDVFKSRLLEQYELLPAGATLLQYQQAARRLFGEPFVEMLTQVDRAYNEVVSLANQHYSDLGDNITRQHPEIRAIEAVNNSAWGEYDAETTLAIAKAHRKARMQGKTVHEFAAMLKEDVDGLVTTYAETLAKTFVKSTGQGVKMEKAAIAGCEYFAYAGPPVYDKNGPSESHVFCKETFRQGSRVFHIRDIRKMRNGQLEPVRLHRGGYRCRHDWEPDPFETGKGYKVEIVTVMSYKREVKFGRHI